MVVSSFFLFQASSQAQRLELAPVDTCITLVDWNNTKGAITTILDYNDQLLDQTDACRSIVNNQDIIISNQANKIRSYSIQVSAYEAENIVLNQNVFKLTNQLEKEKNNRWTYTGIGAGVTIILAILIL